MYLRGDFHEVQAVARAIREVKTRGLSPADLDIFSTEPVLLAPGVLDRPSRMSLTAVSGANAFGIFATGLVYYSQHSYPMVTGGMPLFSFWATGVVTFELTMLGSIVTTFACFLWESGLFRRDKTAPVPSVEPGSICLRVRCGLDQFAAISDCLFHAGAARVEPLEEPS
jgi:hypothetical protein